MPMEYPVPDPLDVERAFTNSIPVTYVIWTDGTTIYADAQDSDLTSYEGTDATTVIQNALNEAGGRSWIHFKGTGIGIDSGLTLPSGEITLTGGGIRGSPGNLQATSPMTSMISLGGDYARIQTYGLSLDGNGNADRGLDLSWGTLGAPNHRITRTHIYNCNNYAIYMDRGDGTVLSENLITDPMYLNALNGTIKVMNGAYRKIEAFGQQLVLQGATTRSNQSTFWGGLYKDYSCLVAM